MSYIRAGHDLYDFEGESNLYVFSDKDYIEDYDSDYNDNASFAQLIINIMRREIDDEAYIQKMIKVLSEKLNVKVRKK